MQEETLEKPLFSLEAHVAKAWEFYKNKLGSPRHICAPMVDQSDLAFRMLCRKYGTDLCYTPMLNSKIIIQDKGYLKSNLELAPEDHPLFIQLCGNDPQTMLKAAQIVENDCEAIDINLGCPQGIAKKGHYGSFLLKEPDLICSMVRTLHDNLKIPVTCKIRILPKEDDTLELCKKIEAAGCSILTVHGRTKEQNKETMGETNWEIVRKIRQTIRIPMFCNGGIYSYEDVKRCLNETKVEGIMSSEALLENPCLFGGKIVDLDSVAAEYLELCVKYNSDLKYIKPHLFKMLHSGLSSHHELRDKLAKSNKFEDFCWVANELMKRRMNIRPEDKFGWYWRHTNKVSKEKLVKGEENRKEKEEENKKEEEDMGKIEDVVVKKRKIEEQEHYSIIKE